jgi:hypothetical protein
VVSWDQDQAEHNSNWREQERSRQEDKPTKPGLTPFFPRINRPQRSRTPKSRFSIATNKKSQHPTTTTMTVNAPTHCTLPPIRTLPTRSPLSFFKRRQPIFLNEAPNPRIVLVRCDKLNSDGLGPMRSVVETESVSGNSSASSAIDFLTLCHRLKVWTRVEKGLLFFSQNRR